MLQTVKNFQAVRISCGSWSGQGSRDSLLDDYAYFISLNSLTSSLSYRSVPPVACTAFAGRFNLIATSHYLLGHEARHHLSYRLINYKHFPSNAAPPTPRTLIDYRSIV